MATQESHSATDLYVLTIPGFVWFKADYSAPGTRFATRCVALGDSQMIVVAGAVEPTPDPLLQGIGVFDLPSMSPRSSYDPNAGPYNSPQAVKNWYLSGYNNTSRHEPIAVANP